MHKTTVKRRYIELRSLYLGAQALKDARLSPGAVTVLLQGDDLFSAEGTLNAQGVLSGMAKLYQILALEDGTEVEFTVCDNDTVMITSPQPSKAGPTTTTTPPPVSFEHQTVFQAKGLRHVHIEPFRPENLNEWEPETEADVYLAFGVLQEYTDYRYCCGASKALLSKLGADYEDSSKPDAILLDRGTDEYLMAEWKKLSSDFKTNHKPSGVDVLVCWHDNETSRERLPPRVVALHAVAKKAAEVALQGE